MGERYILELIQRSMVEVGTCATGGSIKTCKLHDFMRDLSIKKCKEASFLNVEEEVITERKQLRRYALHLQDGSLDVASFPRPAKKGLCIRSLLAFQQKRSEASYLGREELLNMLKCFPMVRVLDLEDANIGIKVLKVGHLIHLRYLNLRHARVKKVASCIGYLIFLVTLDLRVKGTIELPNKFHGLKSLRRLYLPRQFSVIYQEKLSFVAPPIETLKNFCPVKCEMKDLLSMAASLRDFSISEESVINSGDELQALPKLLLLSSVRLQVAMGVIDKDPTILCRLFDIRCFLKLKFLGYEGEAHLERSSPRYIKFPYNLTRLQIRDCQLEREVILELEELPHLQALQLLNVSTGKQMTFSVRSFSCLNFLSLSMPDLEKWELKGGAVPILQRLMLHGCGNLQNLPRGLPDSVDIECYDPCITGIENYNTCPHFNPFEASACT